MLPKRFVEPAGFVWGRFADAKGAYIRYGSLQPEGPPRGTIVIASGFRELIEKYFEVIRDMADRGFSVWILDWHGQGGSDRFLPNPQKMYSEGYDEHIATLHQFTGETVKKSPGPLILLAHSMGAHISLRYMKEHDGVFDSSVLTAPMCDILTPGFAKPLARLIVDLAAKLHCLDKYVPYAHDWNASDEIFPGNNKTSDPERFAVTAEIFKAKPALKMGMPTYGWVRRTFDSIAVLNNAEYLRAINTPVLIGVAGQDTIVDQAAELRACGLLPQCLRVDIPEARHEIWMEREALRAPWLARVSDFLEESLKKYQEKSVHCASKLG